MSEFFWTFTSLAIAASFTPGPNNIMITASGANFGYLRSLPHMLGVTFGFPVMLVALAFGLGEVFRSWPVLHEILRYMGGGFLLYMAWRIAVSGRTEVEAPARPLTFLQASAFQWINPKGVLFAISVIATFTADAANYRQRITAMALITLFTAFASINTWCIFGIGIRRFLRSEIHLRLFNITMALLLAGSVVYLFFV
jgi:threonine/homoserine/homoserine lactone efflux protein